MTAARIAGEVMRKSLYVAGVIAGIVADAQDAVLPGVTLTLRNTDTGVG